MRTAALLALATAMLLPSSRDGLAETVVTALSTSEVRITSNFSGDTLTLFGAIVRDAATVSRTADYEVVVVLRGPPETVVVRRKERFFGIWVNRASATFANAPSFYVLHSTRPLADIAGDVALSRLELGIDHVLGQPSTGRGQFAAALVRLETAGLHYAERPDAVQFLGDQIFRTTLPLPANVPVGLYTVDIYLFNDGVLLARNGERFSITKSGFEQVLSGFSREQPLIFGVACVAMALAVGWLAGVIFRRD